MDQNDLDRNRRRVESLLELMFHDAELLARVAGVAEQLYLERQRERQRQKIAA